MSEEGLRHVKESTWPLIALIAIVAFSSVAMFSEWPWEDSPWDVMTAFGTVGATLAAVLIAASSERRMSRENERRAVVLKWMFSRWAGSVQTGADLLATNLDILYKTPKGTNFGDREIFMIKVAQELIDPSFMLPYTDRLHVLGDIASDSANMISLAWALDGNLKKVVPWLSIAHDEMEVVQSCQRQASSLGEMSKSILPRL